MSVSYVLREGVAGFGRAKISALGSVMTIMIALLLLGLFRIVSANTGRIVDGVRTRIEMEAFLAEPISRQRIDEIQRRLTAIEGIDHIQFVSKEEAARVFGQEFGEDINSVLQFNPLPPSVKIFLKAEYRSADRAREIQQKIRTVAGVDDVVYRKDMLEFIEKQTRMIDSVGLTLGILLAVSSIFLTSNTIRLTIASRRTAIRTMKLVGASRLFVRSPFLIEGCLQGLIAGLLAAGVLYYLMSSAAALVSSDLAGFIRMDWKFYAYVVVLGIVLGFFGSAISVRRFIGETV